MYKKIVGASSAALVIVGLLIAGGTPGILASVWSTPIPPADLSDPSSALTWLGFASARVLGAVLLGIGLAFFGAIELKGREAKDFALRALAIVTAVPLIMTTLQAWALVPRPQAWALVFVLATIVVANVVGVFFLPERVAASS